MTDDEEVQLIAGEIMAYLNQRPLSADTLEGIAYWWLVQQSINRNVELVKCALARLEESGLIKKSSIGGNQCYYHLVTATDNKQKKDRS